MARPEALTGSAPPQVAVRAEDLCVMSPTGKPSRPSSARLPVWRRRLRRAVALASLILLVSGSFLVGVFDDQTWSFLTHRKGAPAHTEAYAPLPTAPRPLLRLAVAGDVGEAGPGLDATAARMASLDDESPYDVLLLLGDNVYPDGDPERIPQTVFEPFREVLDGKTTLLAVLGNHDVRSGHGDAQMRVLGMPGHWWSRDFGEVLIVGLDSNDMNSKEQIDFLDSTLAASDARWKVVALHHPPYSAGYHGSSADARRVFSPVFARHGVQLVLSGHDHDYQRSKPISGVTYVVSGAGSRTRSTAEADFTAVSWSSIEFLDVTILRDHLVLRAVDREGSVGDQVVIGQRGRSAPPHDDAPAPTGVLAAALPHERQ